MNTGTVYLLVIISTAFWGANFVLAGPVMSDLHPLWAAALRFVIGTMAMLALAFWRHEPLLAPLRRHAGVYLLLGLIGIGGFNLLFFYALQSTSPTNAALIMATNPLITTLIAALLLNERPSMRQLAAIPLALIGTVLAYLFWNTGIAQLGAGRTSLFLNLVPVFAMLAGVVGGVIPSQVLLIGGLLVVGGVSIAMMPRRRLASA